MPLDPEAVAVAVAEGRYCSPCEKIFLHTKAIASHNRNRHGSAAGVTPATMPEPPAAQVSSGPPQWQPGMPVTFFSPRAHSLRVVIEPARWRRVKVEGIGEESRSTKGKSVQFDAGRFTTKDPKIIAFLRNDKEKLIELGVVDDDGDPRGYDDKRFPVYSTLDPLDMRARSA